MSLTVHFITDDWVEKSHTLTTLDFPERHVHATIREKWIEVLVDFEILRVNPDSDVEVGKGWRWNLS